MVNTGSDYSHLRTISYKDTYGRTATAMLEMGPDGHVYLRDNGRHHLIASSARGIANARSSELVKMLGPSLGLPLDFYQNRRNDRR